MIKQAKPDKLKNHKKAGLARVSEFDKAAELIGNGKSFKPDFISFASHEFKTPMNTIQLSANLIDHYLETGQTEKIGQHSAKITKAIGNLMTTLSSFLSIEQLDSGKHIVNLSSFDLIQLSTEVCEEMQAMAKQGQVIQYSHEGEPLGVTLDRSLVRNCITILLSNAIKFSGNNTVVEFASQIHPDFIRITVSDRGIGIPQEELHKIFNPYFKSRNARSTHGTGLGLNLLSRYTDLLRGEIEIISSLGQGTSISLFFENEEENFGH